MQIKLTVTNKLIKLKLNYCESFGKDEGHIQTETESGLINRCVAY